MGGRTWNTRNENEDASLQNVIADVQNVVTRDVFPDLTDMHFGACPSDPKMNVFLKEMLTQFPNCTALSFVRISMRQLDFVTSLPEVAATLETLSVEWLVQGNPSDTQSRTTNQKNDITLLNILSRLKKLNKLLFPNRFLKLDELKSILNANSNIRHFDGRWNLDSKEGMEIITLRKEGLQLLDLSYAEKQCTYIQDSLSTPTNGLRLRNALRDVKTLISFLTSIATLQELDISNIDLFDSDLDHFPNFQNTSLRKLTMRNCWRRDRQQSSSRITSHFLNAITRLTKLEELDLTGCCIFVEYFHYLENLGSLRVLKCGGFVHRERVTHFGTTGKVADLEATTKFKQDIVKLKVKYPNLEIEVSQLYKYVTEPEISTPVMS